MAWGLPSLWPDCPPASGPAGFVVRRDHASLRFAVHDGLSFRSQQLIALFLSIFLKFT